MDQVTVHAPATVSNVVCGFDCLGFALREPFDEMSVRVSREPGVRIIHHDSFGLPSDPTRNVAGVALLAFLKAVDADTGFDVEITKHIKPGSGIGSSAASACGAVVAANQLLNTKLTNAQLVDIAMAGELLASGTRHADNLAPCIYGGFTLVRSADPLDIVSLSFPPLYATVLHPQIEIKTSEARAMLPTDVPLKAAVRNWSNLGAFVAAMANSDYDLLARSMEDEIVEPVRRSLIPKFDEVKAASMAAGAIGGGISGSGPSIFMLTDAAVTAEIVADAMRAVYGETSHDFNVHVSEISRSGVRFV